MKLSLKIKPSMVGQFFEKKCDRSLVYSAVPTSEDYSALNWPQSQGYKESAAARAGIEWEGILLKRLEEDDSCIVINLDGEDDSSVMVSRTIEALRSLNERKKTIYVYQACLKASKSAKKECLSSVARFDSDVYFSSRMFPDFIKAEYVHSKDKYRLTVIDAKNASYLKVGAEIQIALYVKLLKSIIKDEHIENCYVNEDEGIVWNREKRTNNCLEHIFKLNNALDEIDEFFNQKLPDICDTIDSSENGQELLSQLSYHLNQKCEYCDNFEECKRICMERMSVRLLPYITPAAQKRVQDLIDSGDLEDDSFTSVKQILETDPEQLTQGCYYWKMIANDLEAYEKGLQSYCEGKMERFPKNSTSISFPVRQNFALMLTAQQDINSGRMYAFAWLLVPGNGIDIWGQLRGKSKSVEIYETKWESPGKGTYYDSIVAHNDSKEEFDRIERVFVENIYEILRRINDYKDQDKRKLQCFIMDDYERMNIETTLFDMLENLDPDSEHELINKVMTILFWFQGERMVTDLDEHPGECVENPYAIITSEISRMYVLSTGVAYNLKTTASVFSFAISFDEEDDQYFGIFTNVIEGMSVINAWNDPDEDSKTGKIESLAYHLRKRLFVEYEIVKTIQKDNDDGRIHLSAWPMPYHMLPVKYPDNPEIARLDFENLYEELLKYHEIRKTRVNGIQNAIDSGSILLLEYSGNEDEYYVLNSDNYIGREWHSAFLCEDTPENRLQIMLLRDKQYTKFVRANYPVKGTETVFYPKDMESDYDYEDNGVTATVKFKANEKSGFEPVEGERYLLFEVYADWNSSKTAVGISKLVNNPQYLDPHLLTSSSGLVFDDNARKICSKYWSPDGYSFSPSQENAFIHFFEQNLNILVGPPASGKTDFIARALITLACYYKETRNKSLKIMVTAMSNSAIENVLLKLEKMLSKSNPYDIALYKCNKLDDKNAFEGKNVVVCDDYKTANEMNSDRIQIFGMTCWSSYKEFHNEKKGQMREFDVIVMDEASQVRAMDAFLTLECSNQNTRFLLVGDDDQLPPIIDGKYKENEGEKYIHGSIFHMYLTALESNYPDIIHLSDNFRMNGILCKYPAVKIYGPSYQAFNDKIRKQKIMLKRKAKDKMIASILDADYPLVFCELSGAPRLQQETEVDLVTKLVRELWESQKNESTGNLASEDGNFWRDQTSGDGDFLEGACGIITPHHEHINRLKTSISSELGLDRDELYIGTVDKLQGKERKTVIVSYGVSEPEKIKNESEFIYSRNRFNVSITRGKAKTIVILSDVIAESSIMSSLLNANNSALNKGIDFIHGFLPFMQSKEDGEELVFEEYPEILEDVDIKLWKKKIDE